MRLQNRTIDLGFGRILLSVLLYQSHLMICYLDIDVFFPMYLKISFFLDWVQELCGSKVPLSTPNGVTGRDGNQPWAVLIWGGILC